MTILIADDEVDIRDTLEEFLVDGGYRVITANDGAEALALLKGTDPPQLAILDVRMPVLDGAAVYQRMQADPRLEAIPVVLVTSEPHLAPPGIVALKKPVDLERLLREVKRFYLP